MNSSQAISRNGRGHHIGRQHTGGSKEHQHNNPQISTIDCNEPLDSESRILHKPVVGGNKNWFDSQGE